MARDIDQPFMTNSASDRTKYCVAGGYVIDAKVRDEMMFGYAAMHHV